MADVEAMFKQVFVADQHRNLLIFLCLGIERSMNNLNGTT